MTHLTEDMLAYLEHRLDPDSLARVEAHLQGCETCRAELATYAALAEAGRAVQRLPVNTARGWSAVRSRWRSPLVARVRSASQRVSWQVMFSVAVAMMVMLPSLSLNPARASTPSVPFIQTPEVHLAGSDTATFPATRLVFTSETPTQTLTPTLTPVPITTN